MLRTVSAPTRRGMLVAAAAVGVWTLLPAMPTQTSGSAGREAMRPYHSDLPEYARIELRERLAELRLHNQEIVGGRFQGTVHGADVATSAYREGKVPFPERPLIAWLAGRGAGWDENNNGLRPLLERGRDKATGERLAAESLVAASPANVQFMVKDSRN
jgi:hypothetical protein